MDYAKYFNITALLHRGWTRTRISRFLGEPDCVETVPGQRYPTKGYSVERVELMEKSDVFCAYKKKLHSRSEALQRKKAAQRRSVLDIAEHAQIKVRILDNAALDRRCRRDPELHLKRNTRSTQMLALWKINYVRRTQTNEAALMAKIAGKPGAVKAYWWLRTRILEAIALAYPALADACRKFADERFERAEY